MNLEAEKAMLPIDRKSVSQVISFLQTFGKPYVIHAGFGLYLRGFSSELDDVDVKVFHEDIKDIYSAAKDFFTDRVKLQHAEDGYFGSYLFPYRVEIESKTPVDICNRTGVINDLGQIEFPYSEEFFKDVEYFHYDGLLIPVASLESLFLYYLVLRRGLNDGKDDNQKVREILASDKFSEKAFFRLIYGHAKEVKIISLYQGYL